MSVLFIGSLIISWLLGFPWVFLLLFISYAILLLFTRKLPPSFAEGGVLKKGIFYSPVNGKIAKVNREVEHQEFGTNLTELILVSPWWREHGIYFPIKSEVNSFSYLGNKGHFRYFYEKNFETKKERKPSLTIGMKCSDSSLFGIDFYKCPLGLWPKLITIPGDKGKAQVNMGFFGLGGTTVLYLPSVYELSVKVGAEVIAGQTIIARKNEIKKVIE